MYNGHTESTEVTEERWAMTKERHDAQLMAIRVAEHRGDTRARYDALMIPAIAETEDETTHGRARYRQENEEN